MYKLQYIKKILFLLILMAGIALRLYKWNGYSFWFDEAQWLFMNITGDTFLDSLRFTIFIDKPPLLRFLIYFWSYLGQDEFTLRLLPFTVGILSILMTYKVAKMLFDKRIGFIALFFMSFSPFHIYYSQELTHYGLTILLSLCSIYYLMRVLKGNDMCCWIKFIFFTSLSMYASYICLFLLMTENLFFFLSYIKYKRLTKRWLMSNLVILLLYSPWLIILPTHFPSIDWILENSLTSIFQTLRLFNAGYNANFIIHFFALLLFFPLLLIGIFSNLNKEGHKIKFLVLWLFMPMILSLLFSKIARTFIYRNFIFALPAYYILIALGVVKMKKYIYIPIFSFIFLSGLSLFNYYRNIFPYPEEFYRPGVHAKKDNRGASKYIISNFKEGDVVIHTSKSTSHPYTYYLFLIRKGTYQNEYLPTKGKDYILIHNKNQLSNIIGKYSRYWLVLSYWEPHLLDLDSYMQQNQIKEWLNSNLAMIDYKEFTGIKIFLFVLR